jgi:hypothetical protein
VSGDEGAEVVAERYGERLTRSVCCEIPKSGNGFALEVIDAYDG